MTQPDSKYTFLALTSLGPSLSLIVSNSKVVKFLEIGRVELDLQNHPNTADMQFIYFISFHCQPSTRTSHTFKQGWGGESSVLFQGSQSMYRHDRNPRKLSSPN
jgi:hypothetical protein